MLQDSNCKVTSLNLNDNDGIGPEGAKSVAEALKVRILTCLKRSVHYITGSVTVTCNALVS